MSRPGKREPSPGVRNVGGNGDFGGEVTTVVVLVFWYRGERREVVP